MTQDHLEATYESDLLDVQSRILYPLETLVARESETALGHLFQYWCYRCDGDKPPLEHEFSPREVLPAEFAEWVYWIDVTPENPLNFVFRDRLKGVFSNISDKPLRNLPSKIHMTACAAEYVRCKTFLWPMYHEIDQVIGEMARHYVRLIVPVADRKGQISKIYNSGRLIFQSDGPLGGNSDGAEAERWRP